jgi:hypothetical protein
MLAMTSIKLEPKKVSPGAATADVAFRLQDHFQQAGLGVGAAAAIGAERHLDSALDPKMNIVVEGLLEPHPLFAEEDDTFEGAQREPLR